MQEISPSPSSRLKSDSSFDVSPSVSSMSVASESSSALIFTTLVLVALERSKESSGSDLTTTIGLELGSGDEVNERDFGIESSIFNRFFSIGISMLSCFAFSTLSTERFSPVEGLSVGSAFEYSA